MWRRKDTDRTVWPLWPKAPAQEKSAAQIQETCVHKLQNPKKCFTLQLHILTHWHVFKIYRTFEQKATVLIMSMDLMSATKIWVHACTLRYLKIYMNMYWSGRQKKNFFSRCIAFVFNTYFHWSCSRTFSGECQSQIYIWAGFFPIYQIQSDWMVRMNESVFTGLA